MPVCIVSLGCQIHICKHQRLFLTNESGTFEVHIPSVASVKMEASDNNVLVLSDSKEDVCPTLDLSYTS